VARGESKTSPRRLLAAERHVRALELRANGYTFGQIATALGYTGRQGAHNAVRHALTRVAATAPNDVELRLELERVDSLFVPTYGAALSGNLTAVVLCLAILDRREHLLANLGDCRSAIGRRVDASTRRGLRR
jgi:hypothetical protein